MPRNIDAQQLRLEAIAEPPTSKVETRSALNGRSRGSGGSEVGTVHVLSLHEARHAASRPSPAELLETPGALLTRSHLRGLGLERRAIDAVFRALPVVELPGYSRPLIRVEEFLELVEHSTYRDDRVRPCHA